MLFYSTIAPSTLQLLKDIQNLPQFNDFLLVGGTSLALQIGHRISIDLDLFTTSKVDIDAIPNQISHFDKIKIINRTPSILNLFIGNVKVDFVSYTYPFLHSPVLVDDLKLASIEDIAAMKLAAIVGRGSKKDFIDLFFLLQRYTLIQLLEFYNSKYPDGSDFLVYKSLTYFEDADIEPMPNMIQAIEWATVKKQIISEVRYNFP